MHWTWWQGHMQEKQSMPTCYKARDRPWTLPPLCCPDRGVSDSALSGKVYIRYVNILCVHLFSTSFISSSFPLSFLCSFCPLPVSLNTPLYLSFCFVYIYIYAAALEFWARFGVFFVLTSSTTLLWWIGVGSVFGSNRNLRAHMVTIIQLYRLGCRETNPNQKL